MNKHSPNTGEKITHHCFYCRKDFYLDDSVPLSYLDKVIIDKDEFPICPKCKYEKTIGETKPSQQEMCKKCGHHGLRHSDGKKHACHIIDCKCKSFQPPKSSEWEDEIDSCISSIVGSQSEVEIMDAANHIKDKVKDLLSQQQKEVEERIRENIKKMKKEINPFHGVSRSVGEIRLGITQKEKTAEVHGFNRAIKAVLTSIEEKGGKG